MKAKMISRRFWIGVVSLVNGLASAGDFRSGNKAHVLIGTRYLFERPIPEEMC
jgi:hypothetical protein